MPPAKEKQKTKDGRRLRSEASRLRIVEAMRDLIREGQVAPRAEDVAARADVGLRSVFRHFDDMESLYREIAALMRTELRPVLVEQQPPADAPDLLEQLVARRAKLFEKIMPLRIAADVHSHSSPFLREDRRWMNDSLRTILRASLPTSLTKDRTLFDALDATMSFEFWRRLREDQGLSVAQAKRVMEKVLATLAARASR
jgi:AcrR family transcriptional regulator